MRLGFLFTCAVLALCLATNVWATVPPRDPADGTLNPMLGRQRDFLVKRGLKARVSSIWKARAAAARPDSPPDPLRERKLRVSGTVRIPVLLVQFANTPQAPVAREEFQRQLFDGPWPTGTLNDYYREVSYGVFDLRGEVRDWLTLPGTDTFYEGEDYDTPEGRAHCNGGCSTGQVPRMVHEAVTLHAAAVDWGHYDNDGPDGLPNSGDDNGIVDAVAIVHPEAGGECGGNANVWSHQYSLSEWEGGSRIVTNSPRAGGGRIAIDDYLLLSGVGCDGVAPNPIGTFAHEFGHVLGLPDLYDTNGKVNGLTSGVGTWCLMGLGLWGGDGTNPARPVQLSPWAKAALGWLDPRDLHADAAELSLASIEQNRSVYRVRIAEGEYYLLVNAQPALFNSTLPGGGLQVWRINERHIARFIKDNLVNTGPRHKGVDLVEADGEERLEDPRYRGSAYDVFPGPQNARRFDLRTRPPAEGQVAICGISDAAPTMTLSVWLSLQRCAEPSIAPSVLLPPTP